MRNSYRIFLIVCIVAFSYSTTQSQSTSKSVYLFTHGMSTGGWTNKNIDSLLTATGNNVYRPTLTGLGERVHLASSNITLNTHILDIVNVMLYENLNDIVLVGHSYGGMVVTGVADSIPERIKKLIYIDAFLPEDGESVISITGTPVDSSLKIEKGLLYHDWIFAEQVPPKDVPHPVFPGRGHRPLGAHTAAAARSVDHGRCHPAPAGGAAGASLVTGAIRIR